MQNEFLFYPRQRMAKFLENREDNIEIEQKTEEIEEETKPKKVKLLTNKKRRK
jgi:hypothetical protein